MLYRQNAEGRFSCETVAGTPHCGRDEGVGHFRYCVEIQYTSDRALDEHGFLIDNLEFSRYFDAIHTTSISCEAMARHACKHFEAILGARFEWVKCIDVKIYPFDGVFVEAEDQPLSEGSI